jgi:phosphoribosylamine-glycine ligase
MVILVTEQWGGLGLALLMSRQGSYVICAYDYTHVRQDDLPATRRCGEGLLQKMRLQEALTRCVGKGALWIFDANDFPTVADDLCKQGELVIGTSKLGKKLEDDRDFATQFAESVGFRIPETEEFHDYASAVTYLQQHGDQAFAYKPDKADPTATYVPQEKDDPPRANTELQEYLQHLPKSHGRSFILQEVVTGIEVAFDLWVRNGQPVAAFCDLESKRKLVGDLGVHLGCAGDYVLALPLDTPGIQQTVAKYLTHPDVADYTGTLDVNVIVVDGEPYFLENGCRFGYNAYPVMFQALATGAAEEILRAWVGGSSEMDGAFSEQVGASLSVVVDFPVKGTPLIIPPEIESAVYLYRAYAEDGQLALVEGWSEVATIVAVGSSIPEAGKRCLDLIKQVSIPDKGYRIDLAGADRPTLPFARYQALQQLGWLPDHDLEEAALAYLATLTD